jgi:hypothetical protein
VLRDQAPTSSGVRKHKRRTTVLQDVLFRHDVAKRCKDDARVTSSYELDVGVLERFEKFSILNDRLDSRGLVNDFTLGVREAELLGKDKGECRRITFDQSRPETLKSTLQRHRHGTFVHKGVYCETCYTSSVCTLRRKECSYCVIQAMIFV